MRPPVSPPTAAQQARVSRMPCSPVQALGLPELISKYRISAWDKCCRHRVTGAAQKALRVKTPATVLPSANSISTRSLRPARFIPALAVDNLMPASVGIAGKGNSPTAIIVNSCYYSAQRKRHLGQLAMTLFVFFARTTRARIIAANLAAFAHEWRRRWRAFGRGCPWCIRVLQRGYLIMLELHFLTLTLALFAATLLHGFHLFPSYWLHPR